MFIHTVSRLWPNTVSNAASNLEGTVNIFLITLISVLPLNERALGSN